MERIDKAPGRTGVDRASIRFKQRAATGLTPAHVKKAREVSEMVEQFEATHNIPYLPDLDVPEVFSVGQVGETTLLLARYDGKDHAVVFMQGAEDTSVWVDGKFFGAATDWIGALETAMRAVIRIGVKNSE